jgi:hypothetical protein
MRYQGYAYRQVSNGPVIFSFVATSGEIDSWAKVPTKMTSAPRNFQRAENPNHSQDIGNFFSDDKHVNSSPTSLILGIAPDFQRNVALFELGGSRMIPQSEITTTPLLCELELTFTPWNSADHLESANPLDDEIAALYKTVQSIYESEVGEADDDRSGQPTEEEEDDEEEDEEGAVDDDAADAGDEDTEVTDETEDEDEDEDDISELSDEPSTTDDGEKAETSPGRARRKGEAVAMRAAKKKAQAEALEEEKEQKRFLESLTRKAVVTMMRDESFRTLSKAKRDGLRRMFKDDLKPGLIIDGQHRVSGTKDIGDFPFSALLLPFASWGELAFQFLVNNGTSKKVGEGLLISIVGDSLTPQDLAETDTRLNRAGVKVQLIQAVMHVHKAPNPFAGMLNFGIPGEKGFLDSKAMKSKVVELWWGTRGKTGAKPNTKKIKVAKYPNWDMYDLFCKNCTGSNRLDRIRSWQDSKKWFEYFRAFWEPVSGHFSPRLWPDSVDKWLPAAAIPSTNEQKERAKLMRVTVLGLLQTAVLQVWADNTRRDRKRKRLGMEDFKIDPKQFRKEIALLIEEVPQDFFLELKYTGFDASKELRDDFVEQIVKILEGKETFTNIKQSHSFWK